MTAPGGPPELTLEDKYRREEGRIFLSGLQALVRLPLDQHRADRRRGLRTAILVSGYRGSPLGGLDLLLQRHADLLREHHVVFLSGVNEDLGATAVLGSQLTHLFPRPRYDGVLGMWYGKAPGVDRSGDVFKHANFAGVGRWGGVLAVAGDDPQAKSSTLPTHSEVALYDALFPVLYPGNVQEVLDVGRLGFELSRYAGLWVGFKVVTDVADGVGTAEVAPDRVQVVDPGFHYEGRPWAPTQPTVLLPPATLQVEREIHYGRLEAARAFAAANGLNRIPVDPSEAWLGLVAAGKTYYDLRQALADLGLDEAALRRYGVRLLQLRMLFPLDPGLVRTFARGLEEVLVLEEKRAFVELFLRDALYDLPHRPRVVGKRDERGQVLVPADGELDADLIARLVGSRLRRRIAVPGLLARLAELEASRDRPAPAAPTRHPYFCSGCPHNRSTRVPEGSLASAGIGCHGLALTMDRSVVGITQMGGEGVHWVGAAPFTDTPHLFQQLGDGTLFHSGSLAIRQAVAAGTHVTFKIHYNAAVAMTGGQEAAGAAPVPELTRQLEAEGVRKILVLTDNPRKYPRRARWARGVEVWHRDRLDEAQRVLRAIPGVTILIYDQRCAAEARRLRKRGHLADPPARVVINEAVCEGCGDCGAKSNCLSVQPVETELGRKTQIHQSSCNKDYSCLLGDCPAFVTVEPRGVVSRPRRPAIPEGPALPDPILRVRRSARVVLVGVGGTGVVTVNQILGTAALLDGWRVAGLDQTGLSQKAGPVVSHLRLLAEGEEGANRVGLGDADLYLGLDLLVAAQPEHLARARPDLTLAVVSVSRVPTGAMVASPEVAYPDPGGLVQAIARVTRKDENVWLDTVRLAEALFGDHMPANLIALGAAYQAGAVPVTAAALEAAIRLNGVAVETGLAAFRAGRRAVVDPAWAAGVRPRRLGAVELRDGLDAVAARLVASVGAGGELRRLLAVRVPELIAYQDAGYAARYVATVREVAEAERRAVPGQTRLAEAVARSLFQLMAYKDEYEVARLHLEADLGGTLARELGGPVRLHYHLLPPLLRALGRTRKVRCGRWVEAVFRVLVALRRLRGTPLDPFGWSRVRRVERALPEQFRALLRQALADLGPETYERAVRLARLPEGIRGYEGVKLRNVARFWAEVERLGFAAPPGSH